jgi:hypothetical protein
LHLSRKTLRKCIQSPVQTPARRQRTSKIDPFKSTVADLLEQDLSARAVVVLQRLRPLGYEGGITVLRNHVRQLRGPAHPPPSPSSKARHQLALCGACGFRVPGGLRMEIQPEYDEAPLAQWRGVMRGDLTEWDSRSPAQPVMGRLACVKQFIMPRCILQHQRISLIGKPLGPTPKLGSCTRCCETQQSR